MTKKEWNGLWLHEAKHFIRKPLTQAGICHILPRPLGSIDGLFYKIVEEYANEGVCENLLYPTQNKDGAYARSLLCCLMAEIGEEEFMQLVEDSND